MAQSESVEFAKREWIDWRNHRRLLGPIGDMLPAEDEACCYAERIEHADAA